MQNAKAKKYRSLSYNLKIVLDKKKNNYKSFGRANYISSFC